MVIRKTTGYASGARENLNSGSCGNLHRQYACLVTKTGYIPSLREDMELIQKSADPNVLRMQGFRYCQVINNDGACAGCAEHSGAIYPISRMGTEGYLPPFHPNCKCTIRGMNLNALKGTFAATLVLWLDMMFGNKPLIQKARLLLGFYGWTGISQEFIAGVLSDIDDIPNIYNRIAAFFERIENQGEAPGVITPKLLEAFRWVNATQEEADRMMDAFARFNITSRESIIQFLAMAAAESGYGRQFLEIGSEAYFAEHGYSKHDRGAGYLQVTFRWAHIDFLEFIGDDYRGADTAAYIAGNYPLEVSVWYWTRKYHYDRGIDEFIDTKMEEGGDPVLIFLKTAYYCGGVPSKNDHPNFNDDINDAISGASNYEITETELIINGRHYELPSRWAERLEAYERLQELWP